MSQTTQNAVYYNGFRPDTCRQICLPVTGAGAGAGVGATLTSGAALTYGNWADIVLLAGITLDTLVIGIAVDTPSGAEVFTIDIGSCVGYANAAAVIGAGAGAIAAAHRAECRLEIASDAGGYLPVYYFGAPIFIPTGVGILGRLSTVSGADTLNVSVICLQNFA